MELNDKGEILCDLCDDERNWENGIRPLAQWVGFVNTAIANDLGYGENETSPVPMFMCINCFVDTITMINPALPNEWLFDKFIRLFREVPVLDENEKDGRRWVLAEGAYLPQNGLADKFACPKCGFVLEVKFTEHGQLPISDNPADYDVWVARREEAYNRLKDVHAEVDRLEAVISNAETDWDLNNCSGDGHQCKYFGRNHFCDAPGEHPRGRDAVGIAYLKKRVLDCPMKVLQ